MTEPLSSLRRVTALVLAAFIASAAPRGVAATTTIKTVEHKVPVPPDIADRLRKAGLDPSSPNLAAELKVLAGKTGPAYVRSHTLSTKATRLGASPVMPHLPAAGSTVAKKAADPRFPSASATIPGSPGGIWQLVGGDNTIKLPGNAVISPSGVYFVLVSTNGQAAGAGVDVWLPGSAAIGVGCTPVYPNGSFHAGSEIQAIDSTGQLARHVLNLPASPADGPAYYVMVEVTTLPIGRPRDGQLAVSFANVSVLPPSKVTFLPETLTVTIDATVDHSPSLTGAGSVDPWGTTGIGPGNASLGSPGVPRVGGGTDYTAQTQGDDLVAAGVSLGPGWKVTSTAIKSASSAVAPDVLVPDNTWRGASVKQGPQGSDLRTITHWHYSGIDSLDYTIEWTLQGPAGQRPLMTMQKVGDCDS